MNFGTAYTSTQKIELTGMVGLVYFDSYAVSRFYGVIQLLLVFSGGRLGELLG